MRGGKFRKFSAYHEMVLTGNQNFPKTVKTLNDYWLRNL